MDRKRIGVLFGGVSPEHEVSVISGHQVMAALDTQRYDPVAVYLGKDGAWFSGPAAMELGAYSDLPRLRSRAVQVSIDPVGYGRLVLVPRDRMGWFRKTPDPIVLDVVLPAFHGGAGEDGGIQGLCEVFNVPYAGSGVVGSALGMDKVLSKVVSEARGVPVVPYVALAEHEWADREGEWLDRIVAELGLPAMVKPASRSRSRVS